MIDELYRDLTAPELRRRLFEAEETLKAIRDGEADALVIRGGSQDKIHALGNSHESYRSIMEAMDIGAIALDADRSVLYANAAMCDMLGCTVEDLEADGLLGRLDRVSAKIVKKLLDESGSEHRRSQFQQTQNGQLRHIVITTAPLPLAFGVGAVVTFTDVTARLAAERASESARVARAVLASANEAMVVCDGAGRVINANTAAMALVEGEALGRRFDEAFPLKFPLASPITHGEDLVTIAIEGSSLQGLEARSAGGRQATDLLISAAPLRLSAEEIGGCVVTLVDNSDRKAIEKHQSLLLRELDHRVKNTLAMVMSIASRTSANATDIVDFRTRFTSRLEALAATHSLLADSAWSGLMLSSVIKRELAPYTTSAGPRLVMTGLDRAVAPDLGITFGLVIHELATNAVKYGALSAESGVVTIAAEEAPEGMIRIVWTESGGPAVRPPARLGFGQTLISRSLNRGNGSGATVKFEETGVICEMVFPLITE